MADRFHADDLATFAEGGVPNFSWAVTYYPGQFFNINSTVTEELVAIEGLSFRVHNFDWQEDKSLHYPRLRLRFYNRAGVFDPWFYLSNSRAVKRTKFRLVLSTPASGALIDLTVAVQDYVLNDDETITFECEHPLVEWRRRAISDAHMATAESDLIPNT